MDHMYEFYNKYASLKTHIKNYFDNYSQVFAPTYCFKTIKDETEKEKKIIALMGVGLEAEEMSELSNYCSIDNLTVKGESHKIPTRKIKEKEVFHSKMPKDTDLRTIHSLKERLSKRTKYLKYKYRSELFISEEKKTDNRGEYAIPGKDILVYVRIYYPFTNRTKNMSQKQCGSQLKLNNVITILGSQTLAHLRDKISCIADHSISLECSENLEDAIGPMAKDVYKSGFFFIEDTFYNDTRYPTNVDYSKVIINWAQRRPQLGPFKTASMEYCRIDSLYLRFGFPWVYKHQGGCEHIVVFSNARFVNCDDELAISEYPKIIRLRRPSCKFCMMCTTYSAQWITMDHERIPHNPCYFCDICFQSYNYIDGEKVGEFKAYAYPRNIEAVKGKVDM